MEITKTIKKNILSMLVLGFAVMFYLSWFSTATAQTPSVTLTVNGGNSAVFSVGDTVTLGWNAVAVSGCTITDSLGGFSYSLTPGDYPDGTITDTPSSRVDYTITCTGNVVDSVTIDIVPTVSVSLNPSSQIVASGQTGSTRLGYTTQHAQSCNNITASRRVSFNGGGLTNTFSISNTSGSVNISNISGNVTFTVTCTGYGGSSASDSATFTLGATAGSATVSVTANPTTISSQSWVALDVNTSGVVSCTTGETPSQGGGKSWQYEVLLLNTNQIVNVVVDQDMTFWIECTDTNGNLVRDEATVTYTGSSPGDPVPPTYNIPTTGNPISLDITHTPLVYDVASDEASTRATLHMEGVTGCTLTRYTDDNGVRGSSYHVPALGYGEWFSPYTYDVSGLQVDPYTGYPVVDNNGFAILSATYSEDLSIRGESVWIGADCENSETGQTASVYERIEYIPIDPSTVPDPRATLNIQVIDNGDANNPPEVRVNWLGEYVSYCDVWAEKTSDGTFQEQLSQWHDGASGRQDMYVYFDTTVKLSCKRDIDSKTVESEANIQLISGGVQVTVSATASANPDSDPGYCWDTRYTPPVALDLTVNPGVTKDPSDNSCIFPAFVPSCPWTSDVDTTVIDVVGLPNTHVRSDQANSDTYPNDEIPMAIDLPAGDYLVEVYTYDTDITRIVGPQTHEELRAEFYDASDTFITQTSDTDDVPDDMDWPSEWSGVTDSRLTIASDAKGLLFRVSDAAISSGNTNSLYAGCIALTKLPPTKPACPYVDGGGRTVIEFNYPYLSSQWPDAFTEYQSYNASESGNHTVHAVTWDGYDSRASDVNQTGESIEVELASAGWFGSVLATTEPTADLADGDSVSLETTFNQKFNMNAGSSYDIGANHAYPGGGPLNDLHVVCVAIDSPSYAGSPPYVSLDDPSDLPGGPGNTVISWSSTDADSCNLTSSPNVFSSTDLNNSGAVVNLPYADTTYTFTLDCNNAYGSNSDSQNVYVGSSVVAGLLPNLRPYDLSLNSDTSWVPDRVNGTWDNIKVRTRVENNGMLEVVDPFSTEIEVDYQWSDPTFTADDNGNRNYSNLIAIGGISSSMSITLNDVPFGEHRFKIDTDEGNDVNESDEGDNERSDFYEFVPVPDPLLRLVPDRDLVQIGDSTSLEYEVNVNYEMNCTIKGSGINESFNTLVTGPILMGTDSVNTAALNNTSAFELECTEPITNTTFSTSARVEVVPEYVEA